MLKRRSFLGAILAAGATPAFVRAGVLMPVREIWVPGPPMVQFTFWNGSWQIDKVKTTMARSDFKFSGSQVEFPLLNNRSYTLTLPPDGGRIAVGKPQVMYG